MHEFSRGPTGFRIIHATQGLNGYPETTPTLRSRSAVPGPHKDLARLRIGAMNEEEVFAAALQKASATERQAFYADNFVDFLGPRLASS